MQEPEGEETVNQPLAQREEFRKASCSVAVPGYRLERCLGSGSFGEVWLAVQERTGQQVALKLMRSGAGMRVDAFRRELEKMRTLAEHPFVLTILDADLDTDTPFLVTPYLRGGSLDRLSEPPDLAQVTVWIEQIAEALNYTHDKFILHCDLKPSNVLLDEEGRVRLADFGQAVYADHQEVRWGTLGYMPPEQAELGSESPGSSPNRRWDVFGFGATAYFLLTRTRPRLTENDEKSLKETPTVGERMELYREFLQSRPLRKVRDLNPTVDQELAALVESCLDIDPEKRPTGMAEVVEDLRRRRERLPLLCRRPWSGTYLVSRALRRPRWQLASLLCVALLVIVGLTLVNQERMRLANEQMRDRLFLSETQRGRTAAVSGDLTSAYLFWASALQYRPDHAGLRLMLERMPFRLQSVLPASGPLQLEISPDNQRILVGNFESATLWRRHQDGFTQEGSWDRLEVENRFGGPRSHRGGTPVFWSEDGSHFAVSFCPSAPISLFGAGFGQEISTGLPPAGYEQVRFTQDLSKVLLTGFGQASVSRSGDLGRPVLIHEGSGEPAALSPDGTLAATSQGSLLEIWNIESGQVVTRIEQGEEIKVVTFSPDGSLLAVGSETPSEWGGAEQRTAGRARIWDLNGREKCPALGHGTPVYSLAFSEDGSQLATGSREAAQVWNVEGGQPRTPPLPLPDSAEGLQFDPTGRRLFVRSGKQVLVWATLGKSLLGALQDDEDVTSFTLSSDGTWLAVGSRFRVGVWSIEQQSRTWSSPDLYDLVLSEDGREVIAYNRNKCQIWDLASGKIKKTLNQGTGWRSLATDGGTLSGENHDEIYDLSTASRRKLSAPSPTLEGAKWDRTQTRLLVAGETSLSLWDIPGDRLVAELPLLSNSSDNGMWNGLMARAQFSQDGSRLAIWSSSKVLVFDTMTGRLMGPEIPGDDLGWGLDFSPDGKRIAISRTNQADLEAVAPENEMEIWDIASGKRSQSFAIDRPALLVRFSPDGHRLAICDLETDSHLRVWDLDSETPLTRPLTQERGQVASIIFHPKYDWVATRVVGSQKGLSGVVVWDIQTGIPLLHLTCTGNPTNVHFTPDGEWMVYGADDGIHLVDLRVDLQRPWEDLQEATQRSVRATLDEGYGLRFHDVSRTPEPIVQR
jgi:WD40 repeat protein